MAGKNKSMCKWKKDEIEERFEDYSAIVAKPKSLCLRCGRVADTGKRLCKPRKIAG